MSTKNQICKTNTDETQNTPYEMTEKELDFRYAIGNMRMRTACIDSACDYWSKDDVARLIDLFYSLCCISEIAVHMNRTEPAVMRKVEELDLYHRRDNMILSFKEGIRA